MTCHECQLDIFIHERFVTLKKSGSDEPLYFHNRKRHDCWDQYKGRHPKLHVKKPRRFNPFRKR